MKLDENKYRDLFVYRFKANPELYDSDFKRTITNKGNTLEVKVDFYKRSFDAIIDKFKTDLDKDENYDFIISALYKLFINALRGDGINADKYDAALVKFKTKELPSLNIQKVQQAADRFQTRNRIYNPNTKYGRRKAREQAQWNYENGTPEYRREIDNIKVIVWTVIIVLVVVFYLFKAALAS